MYLLYLILTLLHILVACLFYVSWNKKLDLFDPFYLISALYIMIFVYAPWIWILNVKTEYQGVEVMSQLPVATIVFNIGYLFYVMGAFAISGKKLDVDINTTAHNIDYKNEKIRLFIIKYAIIVFVISMFLSMLYYLWIGRSILSLLTFGQTGVTVYRRDGEGFYFLKCFHRSAIPASILFIAYSKKKLWAWICAVILADVCINTGSRNLAITVLLSFFIYKYIKDNKRPNYATIIILIIIFYIFIGFIGIFRGTIKAGEDIDLSIVDSDALFHAFMYNAEIFYPFYNVVSFIPQYAPYHYGLGIVNIFVQFIPRIIWPGKPIMLGKTAFQAMYGNSMGGAAYPNIGEYYYEFGITGVIILMFITGYFMRKSYLYMLKRKDELDLILFSIHFGYIVQFICRGHFASWAIDYLFMLGPIFYLKFLVNKKYKCLTIQKSL